jgi:putative holliday junction resolvase
MRFLGVDHGGKRVGVALSDEDGRFAQPHRTLESPSQDVLVRELAALARAEKVEEIVVGLPLHLDGSEGASARRARRFAERVHQAASIPIVFWDERLTTAAADRVLDEAGVNKRARKTMVDRVAAAILLQSYLDARHERLTKRSGSWDASEPAAKAPDGGGGSRER